MRRRRADRAGAPGVLGRVGPRRAAAARAHARSAADRCGCGPGRREPARRRACRSSSRSTRPPAIETVCPAGDGVRLDAQAGRRPRPRHGRRSTAGRCRSTRCAVIDDTAAYYARHTSWRWSAGVGTARRRPRRSRGTSSAASTTRRRDSERTVWVDGEPSEAPPCTFAEDLSSGRRPALRRRGRARATREPAARPQRLPPAVRDLLRRAARRRSRWPRATA